MSLRLTQLPYIVADDLRLYDELPTNSSLALASLITSVVSFQQVYELKSKDDRSYEDDLLLNYFFLNTAFRDDSVLGSMLGLKS